MKISTVLGICLFSGLISNVNMVIDWAIWGPIIGSGVAAGGSMIQAGTNVPFTVVVKMEIENWSKFALTNVESKPNGGNIKAIPAIIAPGVKEMMVAHKTPNTATGTYGVASWLIANKNRRIVVMWSAPYSFDFHSNWLAVGMTSTNTTSFSNSWFNQMYNGYDGHGLKFIRKEYYKRVSYILFQDPDFEIQASMGTSHKPKIHIVFRPKDINNIALSLKDKMHERMMEMV